MLAPAPAVLVRVAALGGLEELARAHGIAFERLLENQGIAPEWFTHADNRIAFRQLVGLLDDASAAIGDDCIGLHLGAAQSLHCSGILGYAAQASPDVRASIALAGRYFGLHQEGATLRLQTRDGTASVAYEVSDPQVPMHRQDTEMTMALCIAQVRLLTGLPQWSPSSMHFVHPAPLPASERELRRFFGCALHFADTFDGARFPERFLATPTRTADANLLQILTRYAEECLARQDDTPSWAGRTRRLIAAGLASGRAGIDEVAQSLAMTPRSLQRRLADEGKHFSDLVEDTRRDLAVQYLRDPRLSLTDAAFLVGYSDLTAFHRAFRRWFNQTPLAYQRQLKDKREGLSSEVR